MKSDEGGANKHLYFEPGNSKDKPAEQQVAASSDASESDHGFTD